jgi:prepilin-type N-terminal cleavage/methylation domain-containing protein
MKNSRGFTLIELLVVIAIIGILSSVVLASLNTARLRGADGSIKSSLSNARSQAELFYDTTGAGTTYDGVCTAGTNNISAQLVGAAKNLLSSATTATIGGDTQPFVYSNVAATGGVVCHDSSSGWGAIVSLKNPTTANAGWCVDSTGFAGELAASATTLVNGDVTCQ